MKINFVARATLVFAAGGIITAAAPAAVIQTGDYTLRNHPAGSANPPPYGARFDELYNATSGNDVFTLNFNHIDSLVRMTVTATTIRIFGQSFGGRDTGTDYANDLYRGVYTFDFLYNTGVQSVPGDDDIRVNAANRANSGFIDGPGSLAVRNLVDERDGGFSLRIGDEDNDLGHRGFNGISGWGWMTYVTSSGGFNHVNNTDWIFTATRDIPTPGSAGLAIAGALLLARRRR